MEWYIAVLKNYTKFDGRARRTEYWMFFLFNFLITVGLAVVEGMLGSPGVIGMVYGLAVFLPSLAVAVRRLHDINRSGWWVLIGLIPLLGIIVLLIFFIKEGDESENQFGANPKAVEA